MFLAIIVFYYHFKTFVSRTWKPLGNFEIYRRYNDLIKFANSTERDNAINGGPYLINGKFIILKKNGVTE